MRISAIVLLTMTSGLLAYAAAADVLDKPLARYKENRSSRGLRYFCARVARMPCGIETIPTDDAERRKDEPFLDLADTTPRKVLDAIVAQTPGTRWTIRSGVISIEPKSRTGEDLLERKVPQFSAHGVSSFQAALDAFDDAGINVSYEEMGHRRYFGDVDIALKDASVRDILNAIVKADGDLIWLFSHSSDPERSIKGTLVFFTERRSGGKTFSDEWKKTKRWKREHGETQRK